MPKINHIFLEILEACNCACEHCYASKSQKYLSRQDWFKIVDLCVSNFHPKNIIIVGGEPTLHPDIYPIISYCISKVPVVSIQTNGTLPSYFQNYNCEVNVSFESCFKDENDKIRKFANSNNSVYELAVKKMMAGKKYDNPRICRMTLYNDSDVLASIVFAEKLGANLTLVPLIRQGCAENLIHRIPNAKKINEAIQICMEANEKMQGHHEVQVPQWYLTNLDLFNKYKGLFYKQHRICSAGVQRLFVSSDGSLRPCMFLPKISFGNILKDKISKIEKNINEFNDKIKAIEPQGKCKKCDAWNYCHGGCVASYIKNKKQMGENCPMIL